MYRNKRNIYFFGVYTPQKTSISPPLNVAGPTVGISVIEAQREIKLDLLALTSAIQGEARLP